MRYTQSKHHLRLLHRKYNVNKHINAVLSRCHSLYVDPGEQYDRETRGRGGRQRRYYA